MHHHHHPSSILSDVEEEYQDLLTTKEEKASEYKDLEAELGGLIRHLEAQQSRLDKLKLLEKEANVVLDTYPDKISDVQTKLVSSSQLISVPLMKEEAPRFC